MFPAIKCWASHPMNRTDFADRNRFSEVLCSTVFFVFSLFHFLFFFHAVWYTVTSLLDSIRASVKYLNICIFVLCSTVFFVFSLFHFLFFFTSCGIRWLAYSIASERALNICILYSVKIYRSAVLGVHSKSWTYLFSWSSFHRIRYATDNAIS